MEAASAVGLIGVRKAKARSSSSLRDLPPFRRPHATSRHRDPRSDSRSLHYSARGGNARIFTVHGHASIRSSTETETSIRRLTMNTIVAYRIEELGAADREGITGGNPVPLALALGSAFVWGFKWGYNVAGPWLVDNT